MRKALIIQILKRESEYFYGSRVAEKIFDFKRIAIYQCAVDCKENVLFFFRIDEQERIITFYYNSSFTKRVQEKIELFSYPIKNARRVMYGNFRFLPKMVKIEYED